MHAWLGERGGAKARCNRGFVNYRKQWRGVCAHDDHDERRHRRHDGGERGRMEFKVLKRLFGPGDYQRLRAAVVYSIDEAPTAERVILGESFPAQIGRG